MAKTSKQLGKLLRITNAALVIAIFASAAVSFDVCFKDRRTSKTVCLSQLANQTFNTFNATLVNATLVAARDYILGTKENYTSRWHQVGSYPGITYLPLFGATGLALGREMYYNEQRSQGLMYIKDTFGHVWVGIGTSTISGSNYYLEVNGDTKITGGLVVAGGGTFGGNIVTTGSIEWGNFAQGNYAVLTHNDYWKGVSLAVSSKAAYFAFFFSPFAFSKSIFYKLVNGHIWIGIGTNDPSYGESYDEYLKVAGVAVSKGWYTYSDARLKNIQGEVSNVLDKIEKIDVVRYTWKGKENDKPHIGVVAQNVMKYFPEVVSGSENTTYVVDYDALAAIAIEAAKELKKENDKLKAQVKELQSQVEELKVQLEELRKELEELKSK